MSAVEGFQQEAVSMTVHIGYDVFKLNHLLIGLRNNNTVLDIVSRHLDLRPLSFLVYYKYNYFYALTRAFHYATNQQTFF